jgi:hypothetical protein
MLSVKFLRREDDSLREVGGTVGSLEVKDESPREVKAPPHSALVEIKVPIQYMKDSAVQYRNGDIHTMQVYGPCSREVFEISSILDDAWTPAHIGADDRHPRLLQHLQCSLTFEKGNELAVKRTEVEFQNGVILKIGHKDEVIVRFLVLSNNKATHVLTFSLQEIWVRRPRKLGV